MKKWKIVSKTYGTHYMLLDKSDYIKLKKLGKKWCITLKRERFYPQTKFNKRVIEIQRYLMNPPKDKTVDHINNNPLDNRRKNLRICSNAANLRNGRIRKNNKSGYIGVYWSNRDSKWRVQIKVNYKMIYLGGSNSFNKATQIRKAAELKYWNI